MISRRIIRVKVMQCLYALDKMETEVVIPQSKATTIKLLKPYFEQSKKLLIFMAWHLAEVAGYVEKEAGKRASKHLPSAEDLNVNIKLAGNEVIWKFRENSTYSTISTQIKNSLENDENLVRKTYFQLIKTPQYQAYIASPSRSIEEDKKILLFILNDLMLSNDDFISYADGNFTNWNDDGEIVAQYLSGLINKPNNIHFSALIDEPKEEFAISLLQTVQEKNAHLKALIVPKLKNWDAERIAQLDMILLKMGLAEFLYFDTIPPKVTINEYIDLAKDYSTPQSGQFVNGILDSIHKEMVDSGKMQKTEFKKK